MTVVAGQRYASATEPELGLGIAIEVEGRRVSVLFPAAEERRVYALDSSPLNRIRYTPGDRVDDVNDRALRVTGAIEKEGLMIYQCEDSDGHSVILPELDLSAFAQFTTPVQRLTTAQIDPLAAYRLRVRALHQTDRLQRSPVRGLMGPRVALLPHQLHIADTVANRFAPRVLLADEVGLGKTIEAGMIIHHQLETARARRVLVLVPDSLVYQWLVEMLRRFNLSFALFDQDRIDALREEGIENPFEADQRVLCSLSLLTENPDTLAAALDADWDLVIVDEAHHLVWSDDADTDGQSTSPYRCVEELALRCAGLLLLTATPQQLGEDSHFARLRLLDPARFHDVDAFREEQAGYRTLNKHIEPLLDHERDLTSEQATLYGEYLKRKIDTNLDSSTRAQVLRDLLDRHGTGRVLFRNTRAAVPDFPTREVHVSELECPEIYTTPPAALEQALYPESRFDDDQWLRDDPRVAWLVSMLKAKRSQKVLVICHRMETARALDEYLTLREGLRSTSFYEGLSLLERDRAAAYFSEGQEDGGGAQVLVCSEIGSEGRNFQFAHHLVLFDLPLLPDLLEQRIGRLDRIGQRSTIHIHVPCIESLAGHTLLRWQHEGLDALSRSASGAQTVFNEFETRLLDLLNASPASASDVSALIEQTRVRSLEVAEQLRQGRDRLIELNSSPPADTADCVEQLRAEEADGALQHFLTDAFEYYGVEQEEESADTIILRPSERMTGHFPGLTDDGLTATYRRDKALAREDVHYMTWEHPIAKETLAMTVHSDVGNAALSTISLRALPPATMLLEAWFTVAVVAPAHLQIERYLSLNPTRLLILANGKDVGATLAADQLDGLCKDVDRKTARAVLKQVRTNLGTQIEHAKNQAQEKLPAILAAATSRMRESLGAERDRLQALAAVNANVRADELAHLDSAMEQCAGHIERAQMRLDTLRLIVNTGS
ncbi:MAG: RNA polymerase-associated protein RapA [Gammaproteobacteria bacterium]